ncbi:TIGR00266 family protein [Stieleria sp. JC731]|nr:TIGR00266 family protein [Stieleria sp. JC731]
MCGKHYKANDDMAGKMVNCRTCGHAFPVPNATPVSAADPFDDAGFSSGNNSTADHDDQFSAGVVQISSAPVTMRGGQSSDGVYRTSDEIDYEIFGHETQYVEITLDPGEQTIAEAGALMYMTDGIKMATVFGDPSRQDTSLFGKVLSAGKRVLTGEALFMTTFTNESSSQAQVAFGAPYPGRCIPLHLDQLGGEIICQKDAFLCGARGITVDIAFQKKIGAGLFGGEGFIMQRLRGDGIGIIHAGGTMMYRELEAGETIRLDTGCLVAMGPTVNYDVEFVGGLKNAFFGGEGLFLATVRGPGPVWLQSLPFSRFAGRIAAAIPSGGNTRKGEGSLLGDFGEMFMGD